MNNYYRDSVIKVLVGSYCMTALLPHRAFGLESSEDGLTATLSVNRATISSNDRFQFAVTLKNVSSKVLLIPPVSPYAVAHLTVSRASSEVTTLVTGILTPDLGKPPLLIKVRPGDEYSIYIDGSLTEGKLTDVVHGTVVRGGFLDFQHSAFALPESGAFSIIFRFKGKTVAAQSSQELAEVQEVWVGKVVSNPVILFVKLKHE